MREIGFYSVEGNMNSFLHSFFSQLVYKNGKKVLLYSSSTEKLKDLDRILWENCGGADFLCHSIYSAKNSQGRYEKLLLSSESVNFNEADYLVMSTFIDKGEFLESFDKGFYLYAASNEESIERARSSRKRYDEFGYSTIIYVKGDDGRWKTVDDM
ncbi:MAG: DNA polymerase III subunit chi [Rickettsiales bacterium]|jgi:DNA polymerase IIIc chi subunit|nr:DNA polymerase III subunit chi [Rickettsiales bacterium]